MKLSSDDWLNLLINSQSDGFLTSPFGDRLPSFPSEEVQRNTTSLFGEAALRQAYSFYSDINSILSVRNSVVAETWKILDFGSCWGRITRFFMRDVPLDNIYGLDVDQEVVDECGKLFHGGNFETCSSLPPCQLPDSSMDLISAYSVFSHLSEKAFIAWMNEFHRLLRSGGIVAFTTRNDLFLDYCETLKTATHDLTGYNAALASMISDIDAAKKQYHSGDFLFMTGRELAGGGARNETFYGESFIPQQYVEKNLSHLFNLESFSSHNKGYDQALFILKKP